MIRLYVAQDLAGGHSVQLSADQAHYISSVMRKTVGDDLLLFNGRDGEWHARITQAHKKTVIADLQTRTRHQEKTPDIWLVFAPLKKNRLDFLIEKATELGVDRLLPVLTRRTVVTKVRLDRLNAQAIEAAEQCERLNSPQVQEPLSLDALMTDWPEERTLYMLDEQGGAPAIAAALQDSPLGSPAAILVGPEGGFEQSERDFLKNHPCVKPISIGPRILRAETAAVAALSCWQALQGDWDDPLRDRTVS